MKVIDVKVTEKEFVYNFEADSFAARTEQLLNDPTLSGIVTDDNYHYIVRASMVPDEVGDSAESFVDELVKENAV